MNRALTVLRLRTAAALFLSVGVLSACAGENLFQIAAVGGQADVEITSPADDEDVPVGTQLEVIAEITVPAGGADVEFKGEHPGGAAAYVAQNSTVTGLLVVELTATMNPAGTQTTGEASIIVTVTGAEDVVADTVKINISN